jgi:hypothetical protein
MKISAAFPTKYLSAADLDGRIVSLTMKSVLMEDIGFGGDKKVLPVLYFDGKDKGLVLNKTNSKKIAELFGDDTDNWTGEQIALFEAMVEFQGDTVAAIRVKQVPRNKPPKTTAETINDDIPF